MNPFTPKIPRGIIYHSIAESLEYLFLSLVKPLDQWEKVREFEKAFAAYCGRQHCVAFPFARTALYSVLEHLKLPSGTQVLMPCITIKGILDVIVDLGLEPVYVDSDPQTAGFLLEDLRGKIGPRTKVALVTHLFGLVPDMGAMLKVLKNNGVYVIEDFSQCLNGRFEDRKVGTFGEVGIYSSSSIKTLDCLGGGMAITDDPVLAGSLREKQEGLGPPDRKFLVQKAWTNLVRNLATKQPFYSMFTFPFLQVLRWRNPALALKQTGNRDQQRIAKLPGLWFRRFTSFQAQIGLKHLGAVGSGDQVRRSNVEFIKSKCGPARFPQTTTRSWNVYWQLILLVPNAMEAQSFLAGWGVDSATSSLELISALKDYSNRSELPNAERIYHNGLFIPCYPHLTTKGLERIALAVQSYFQGRVDGK